MTEKTEEQKAAEAAAAAQAKAEAKALKDAQKAEAKAKKDAEKAAAAEQKAAAKAAAEQAKKDAAAAKEAEKLAAKEAAEAAKAAQKMPESNGVRRPKPETLCGQAWAIFDEISTETGSPAAIGPSLERAKQRNLNEGNVRAEYARWRKFFGITGRIAAPKAETAEA